MYTRMENFQWDKVEQYIQYIYEFLVYDGRMKCQHSDLRYFFLL